jgi:DNA-binding transcriptional ArsR family regulator
MEHQFAQIASLIGEPTRATIMWSLLDGKAFTASELAITANTTQQSISMHLHKLVKAGLLIVESQGRHKYYKYAGNEIAYAIEAMANLVQQTGNINNIDKQIDNSIRYCRSCYDHLAGKVGVAITDSLLLDKKIIKSEHTFELSAEGYDWFTALGIDIEEIKKQRRSFLRPCLDWTERRYHIAGALGAALFNNLLLSDWIRRTKNSRSIIITSKGRKELYENFKLEIK